MINWTAVAAVAAAAQLVPSGVAVTISTVNVRRDNRLRMEALDRDNRLRMEALDRDNRLRMEALDRGNRLRMEALDRGERREHDERIIREDDEARQVLVEIGEDGWPFGSYQPDFNRLITLSAPHTYPIKQIGGCMVEAGNGNPSVYGFGHHGDVPDIDEQRIYYRFRAKVPPMSGGAQPIMRFTDSHGNLYYQYRHYTQRFPQNTDWPEAVQVIDEWIRTGAKPDE